MSQWLTQPHCQFSLFTISSVYNRKIYQANKREEFITAKIVIRKHCPASLPTLPDVGNTNHRNIPRRIHKPNSTLTIFFLLEYRV